MEVPAGGEIVEVIKEVSVEKIVVEERMVEVTKGVHEGAFEPEYTIIFRIIF